MAVPTSPEDSTAPKSTHLADPALRPFLQSTFDPADYLNATLPSLSLSSTSSRPLKHGNAVPLAELASQTQDLISQLNAHTNRLSAVLTQLTDDILRSGGRLAYEVEVLRGDTVGLTETLEYGLKGDVEKFLPGGIVIASEDEEPAEPIAEGEPTTTSTTREQQQAPKDDTTPEYITQLRTLTLVRTRLESVIKIFGEAMHWNLPPSEASHTSSLISVSAPTVEEPSDLEARGKEFEQALRSEIADLITGSEDGGSGAEAAAARIQALRDLAKVWEGTAEEKARVRFVDGLAKLAEEKQNAWGQKQRPGRSGSIHKQAAAPPPPQKSGGFLDNLQRLRENMLE